MLLVMVMRVQHFFMFVILFLSAKNDSDCDMRNTDRIILNFFNFMFENPCY